MIMWVAHRLTFDKMWCLHRCLHLFPLIKPLLETNCSNCYAELGHLMLFQAQLLQTSTWAKVYQPLKKPIWPCVQVLEDIKEKQILHLFYWVKQAVHLQALCQNQTVTEQEYKLVYITVWHDVSADAQVKMSFVKLPHISIPLLRKLKHTIKEITQHKRNIWMTPRIRCINEENNWPLLELLKLTVCMDLK